MLYWSLKYRKRTGTVHHRLHWGLGNTRNSNQTNFWYIKVSLVLIQNVSFPSSKNLSIYVTLLSLSELLWYSAKLSNCLFPGKVGEVVGDACLKERLPADGC